jgi:uncharacterized protein YkwD
MEYATVEWLRTLGVALLLVFAGIGAASVLGFDVTVEREQDGPATAGADTDTRARPPATTTTGSTAEQPAPFARVTVRERFVTLLNDFRETNGRARLSEDTRIVQAAAAHSRRMAEEDFFDHVDPNGRTHEDRLRRSGVSCSRSGENIAQTWWREEIDTTEGPTYLDSPRDVARSLLTQWRNSTQHRDILLLRGVTRVGLGIWVDDAGRIYATLNVC